MVITNYHLEQLGRITWASISNSPALLFFSEAGFE